METTLASSLPPGTIQPRRCQIYLGFRCSQGCGFCYHRDRWGDKMFPLAFVKREIEYAMDYGIRDLEGEKIIEVSNRPEQEA